MSHIRQLITCCALCLAVAACNKGGSAASDARQANDAPADVVGAEDSCPVQVPATTVTVVNTRGGVALYFTTTTSRVEEVRQRVEVLAKMEVAAANPDAATSATALPEVDVPWVFGAQPRLVPLQAKVEDVSDGASLVLAPLNPMDVEQLRAYARSHADRMRLGRCPADFMRPRRAEGPLNAIAPPNDTLG